MQAPALGESLRDQKSIAMSAQTNTLSGKRIILLGASSGIGLATAQAAAAEGAIVVIVSGNQQRINQALQTIPEGATAQVVDLSKEEKIRDFFEHIGRFDHLIYTAGENLPVSDIQTADIPKAKDFFDIRFWGAFAAVKYGSPLVNPGGSINLTSGTAGTRPPGKGWSAISSICGAMESFVRAMAIELAPIRVNCVIPGVVKTNLWNSMSEKDRDGLHQWASDSLLVKRTGEAEDIAQTFVYFMKQTYGTGQSLIVDGGGVLV